MTALTVLLGAAAVLLAISIAARLLPGMPPSLLPGATVTCCLAGLAAALVAPAVATLGGPVAFGIDGYSAVMLAALFIWGTAVRGGPMLIGVLALAMLAADGWSLWLALAAAMLAATRTRSFRPRWAGVAVLLCLAAALFLLGGADLRFAAIRTTGADGLRGIAVLALVLGAATLLAQWPPLGPLAAAYLIGRLLLDLCGPATPGWWGVTVLSLGAGLALHAARRAAAAQTVLDASAHVGAAALAVAITGFGAALLARGADLLPVASLAMAGALFQVLCWGAWGGLLQASGQACAAVVGNEAFARMGGLLRRMPATGLAMLVALASAASIPATAGFAGAWTVLQAVLSAARAGGLPITLLTAGIAATLGLTAALLATAAVRTGAIVLLGAHRTAKATAATDPRRLARLGLGALSAVVLLLGVWPASGFALVAPGAHLLAGAAFEGSGLLLAPGSEASGYASPILTALLALLLAAAAWATRTGTGGPTLPRTLPWQGGFIEDTVGRANTFPLAWPLPRPTSLHAGRVILLALSLALAALLGWAAH